jgi:hypothetical protein
MQRKDFFDLHPNLGCRDSATSYCFSFPAEAPGIGNVVVVFDSAFNNSYWIEEGNSYRRPTSLEYELFESDVSVDFWFSKDKSQLLLINENQENNSLILKTAGSESKIDIETGIPPLQTNSLKLLEAKGKLFLFVTYGSFETSTDNDSPNQNAATGIRLYAIDISSQPIASRLLVEEIYQTSNQAQLLAISDENLTVKSKNKVINYELQNGRKTELLECRKNILVGESNLENFGSTGIAVCRNEFYIVTPGSLGSKFEFSFEPDDAGFVRHHPNGLVVGAFKRHEALETVKVDGTRATIRFGTLTSAPVLEKVWLENDRPCGVVKGLGQNYLCQTILGTWQEVEFPYGDIADITRRDGSWWAIATKNNVAEVLVLSKDSSGRDVWAPLASVPTVGELSPRFISSGLGKPGVETGSGATYVFVGQNLVPQYPRQTSEKAYEFFHAVIDTEGQLYDACDVSEFTLKICVYLVDGTRLETGFQQYAYQTTGASILEKGVLINGRLFRGTKHIPLSNLYGELYGFYPTFQIGDRKIYIGVSGPLGTKSYTYDGKVLALFDESSGSAFESSRRINSDSVTKLSRMFQKPEKLKLPQYIINEDFTYQDSTGIWIRVGTNGNVKKGTSLLRILSETRAADTNIVRDTFSIGTRQYVVNDIGILSCPDSSFAKLTQNESDVPLALECRVERVEAGITKFRQAGEKFVALKGKSILMFDHMTDESPTILSQTATVTNFHQNEKKVYWAERNLAYTFDTETLGIEVLPVDAEVDLHDFSGNWLCGNNGLYWVDMQLQKILPSCQHLFTTSNTAFVAANGFANLCNQGSCNDPIPLPLPWKKDSTLGIMSYGATPTLVATFANQVYAIDESQRAFSPFSLTMAGGKSFVFSPVTRIEGQTITTSGGGLIRVSEKQGRLATEMLRFE